MKPRRHRIVGLLLLAVLLREPAGVAAQSLAEVAREAKRNKEASTRRVWTNDELGTALPQVTLLRQSSNPPSLAPFDPTPLPVVEAMLEMAGVQPGEVVFDLGSGDGRIVIMAAEKFQARAVGIEVNEDWVAESRRAVAAKGLAERVLILHANALDVDLRPADVVALYLTPDGLQLLRPHLERTLRPGTRVVSHQFQIPGWVASRVERVSNRWVYLYRIP